MYQTGPPVLTIFIILLVVNVAASIAVASYGARKGFPFAPVLIASVFVGFPLVLLVIAVMPPRTT